MNRIRIVENQAVFVRILEPKHVNHLHSEIFLRSVHIGIEMKYIVYDVVGNLLA